MQFNNSNFTNVKSFLQSECVLTTLTGATFTFLKKCFFSKNIENLKVGQKNAMEGVSSNFYLFAV